MTTVLPEAASGLLGSSLKATEVEVGETAVCAAATWLEAAELSQKARPVQFANPSRRVPRAFIPPEGARLLKRNCSTSPHTRIKHLEKRIPAPSQPNVSWEDELSPWRSGLNPKPRSLAQAM